MSDLLAETPVADDSPFIKGPALTKGRWVGEKLWWDIGDESISDEDLRRWVWNNLPEDSLFRYVGTCILAYHTRAYANRRQAIAEYLKNMEWK